MTEKVFLTKEELASKLQFVDGEGSWHFPKGKELIAKGKRLTKNSGYTIYDVDKEKEVDVAYLEAKTNSLRDYNVVKFFTNIYEYVDRKNKVYYVQYGAVRSESLWC